MEVGILSALLNKAIITVILVFIALLGIAGYVGYKVGSHHAATAVHQVKDTVPQSIIDDASSADLNHSEIK